MQFDCAPNKDMINYNYWWINANDDDFSQRTSFQTDMGNENSI